MANNWVEKKLVPGLNKFGGLRVVRSLTSGFLGAMPILMVGVVFQVISNIATVAVMGASTPFIVKLNVLKDVTFGLLGIYFAYSIGAANAKLQKISQSTTGLFSIALYILLIKPTFVPVDMMTNNFVIDFSRFGAAGMFISLVAGITTGEVFGFLDRIGWTMKGKNLPEFVRSFFYFLIPGALVLILGWVVAYLFEIDLYTLIGSLVAPLAGILDSYVGMVLLGLLAALAWSVGVHPISVIGVFLPVMLTAAAGNAELAAAGLKPSVENGFSIFSIGTFFGFLTIGGTGSTLGLSILLLRSKSKSLKAIGKAAIVPSILNINEPLVFGIPMVFNPVLAVGMMVVNGLVNPILTRLVMELGLVTMPYTMSFVPVLPIGLNTFLTNNDFRGVIFVLALLVLNIFVWLPFFRIHEKRVLLEEASEK